ncbi:alpha/beta hydrolase [Candidatus Chlorohelix sp.]|uniref:alpha/beta hydrolase n=1 Tax=Candidatus Chlorohelix sp. TaxID=3139201 RepID=UPI00306236D0
MPLEPQSKALMDELLASGVTPRYLMTPEEGRKYALRTFVELAGPPEPIYKTEDRTITTHSGNVKIRIYTPSNKPKMPALVYFHGGGWRFGSIETHEAPCRTLANLADCKVISVEYSLSPEYPFPVAMEQSYNATKWVYDNAASLGIDPDRIAVGGDSSGGNLAASACVAARDRGNLPPIFYQVLIYPVVDFYYPGTNSYKEHGTGYFLTAEAMKIYWDSYLGRTEDSQNAYAAPLTAADFEDMPPGLIVLAQYDPLYDEGVKYAEKLKVEGIPAKVLTYEGVMHGFWGMAAKIDLARKAHADVAAELRKAFAQ